MTDPHKVTDRLDLTIVIPVGGMNPGVKTLKSWFTGDMIEKMFFVFVLDSLNPFQSEAFKEIINHQQGKNIKILEVSCKNPGEARNSGLQEVQTTWVSFCDSDDQPNLQNMSEVLNTKTANYYDVIRGRYGVYRGNTGAIPRKFEVDGDVSNHWDLISFGPGIWRYIFKTELVRDTKFPELSLGEDQIFLMRTFWSAPKIKQSELNFYTYFLGSPDALTSNARNLRQLVQVFNLGRFGISDAKTETQKNLALVVMARALITSRLDPEILFRIMFEFFTKVSFSNQIKILKFVKIHLSRGILDNNEQ
jgi:glycosyltransferase involved in cell wall biosynthesis